LFTFIGFPHAEDVADCTSRRVADDDEAASKMAKADHARLTVIPPGVFNLKRQPSKDRWSILKVEAAFIKRLLPLGGIVADAHELSYLQQHADARAHLRLPNT
jgi:hypothetical protein